MSKKKTAHLVWHNHPRRDHERVVLALGQWELASIAIMASGGIGRTILPALPGDTYERTLYGSVDTLKRQLEDRVWAFMVAATLDKVIADPRSHKPPPKQNMLLTNHRRRLILDAEFEEGDPGQTDG